jgi:anhydro-N-acetylmuramic acid kinase
MLVVGLMSGTSGDGIDAALCEITGQPPKLAARIVAGETRPYDGEFRREILNACQPETGSVDRLCVLNVALARRFAGAALDIIQQAGCTPADVALIGSHGQSVWHQVETDGQVTATLQLGEAAVIAEQTGITTISNFRPRDIAAGGQGAPLTGYADWLLLRHPKYWRAVQNIGGMGNVTFLPPLSDTDSQPLAFDTGPGNALIDAAVDALTGGAASYDKDGLLAAQGQIDTDWLSNLLAHPYYRRRPPKTTGRELFGTSMAHALVTEGQNRGLSRESIVATLTALTAHSIADAYQRFAPHPVAEVILGGGGCRNPVLVALLRELLAESRVIAHEAIGIDSDYKEALVFALLAYETWHDRPGNHPAVTGAKCPVVLGQITPGANYRRLLKRTWCDA